MQICLVALNALPAIDPLISGPIGGIETRSWMLARGLATREGIDVRLVVRHHEPLRRTAYDGVELIPLIDPLYPVWQSAAQTVEWCDSFPWVRVKQWHPHLLWQLPRLAVDRLVRGRVYDADAADPRLAGLAADVYATFGVQTHSAVVIRSAHEVGKPAVLFLGSDGDLDPIFEPGGAGVDPYGTRAEVGREILQSADLIIAQTDSQQRRLKDCFDCDSELLLNPIAVDEWDRGLSQPLEPSVTAGLSRYVLWIGRAEEVHKRPQVCLDIARQCPEVNFLMILNPRVPSVEAQIRNEASANVRIVERVPFPQMPAVFAQAAALLNTSQLEGFPNVFLQAALSRVPIVSVEVGEEFLAKSRAGTHTCGDVQKAAEVVNRIWSGETDRSEETAFAREFVVDQHALGCITDRLVTLLKRTIAS